MPTKKKAQPKTGTIKSPEPKTAAKKKTTSSPVGNEIIGSNISSQGPTQPAKPKGRNETVAIYSTRNVSWEGVGKVEKGYNIVSKTEAEKWLMRDHARLATPEELAREYGV